MPNAVGTQPHQIPTCGDLGSAAFIDADRLPVSVPQKESLDLKAPLLHTHLPADITGAPLNRLARLVPTAAAMVDLLSVFTADYNTYMIVLDGLKVSTVSGEGLQIQLAVAGAVDNTSKYYWGAHETSLSSATTAFALTGATNSACSCVLILTNTNDPTNAKYGYVKGGSVTAANTFFSRDRALFYTGAAVSGLRLSWSTGGQFLATGLVRVFGVANT